MFFDAEVGTKIFNPKNKIKARVLLDSGSIDANLINENIAVELVKAGAKLLKMNTNVQGLAQNLIFPMLKMMMMMSTSNQIDTSWKDETFDPILLIG